MFTYLGIIDLGIFQTHFPCFCDFDSSVCEHHFEADYCSCGQVGRYVDRYNIGISFVSKNEVTLSMLHFRPHCEALISLEIFLLSLTEDFIGILTLETAAVTYS